MDSPAALAAAVIPGWRSSSRSAAVLDFHAACAAPLGPLAEPAPRKSGMPADDPGDGIPPGVIPGL
eukprot:1129125-Prymnesium_polylepis.1